MVLNTTHIIIIFAVLPLVYAAFLLFLFYFLQKYKEKIASLMHEHEKAMMTARLEMQEITFQNIAHELHDNINNTLYLSKIQLDQLDLSSIDNIKKTVYSSSALIDKSILDLRHISQALNHTTIRNMGLLNAVRSEVQRYSLPGLFMTKTIYSGEIQPMELKNEVSVFRIVQEAFSNIIKHSKANVVHFEMAYTLNYLDIKIIDNGVGFDERILETGSSGSGLYNMKTRVQMLNGHFELFSQENRGTTIHVVIPYDNIDISLLN